MNASAFVHIIAIVVVVVMLIVVALLVSLATQNNDVNQNSSSNSNNNVPVPTNDNTTLLPGEVSAQVIVTIHSTHLLLGVTYNLFLNSDLRAVGDISAHSSVIQTITLVFPSNQTGLYKAVILATSNGGGFGDKSNQAIITPVSGGTYPVTLNV
jgi:uncharacterized iron-regulated membrane protein